MKNKNDTNDNLNKVEENNFDKVKENGFDETINKPLATSLRLFYKADIIVYLSIVLVVLFLFIIFVFPTACQKSESHGFKVTKGGETVLIFDINDKNRIEVSENFKDLIQIQSTHQGFLVTVYSDETKSGYNVLSFNVLEVSVKVTDSTCSSSKDCVYFPTLTTSGSIYCAPHDLKIAPLSDSGITPPIAG